MRTDRIELKNQLITSSIFIDNSFLESYLDLIYNHEECSNQQNVIIHKHHIIPRCYFKKFELEVDNSEANIVRLSYCNHILAHFYMYQCCSDSIKKELCFSFFKLYYAGRKKIGHEISIELDELQKLLPELEQHYSNYVSQQVRTREKGSTKGKIAIKNSNENKLKYILPEELPEWEKLGWIKGGLSLSEEHKEINRKYMSSREVSAETKKKISNSKKGKESPLKGKKGKPVTLETRKQLSIGMSNKKTLNKDGIEIRVALNEVPYYESQGWVLGRSPKNKELNTKLKGHAIKCLELKQIFLSVRKCCDTLHLNRLYLRQHLKGQREHCNGLHFIYVKNE